MKWPKNVQLSSKSCFSPQELQNLSQATNMKRINPQQLPNLTQDTNMKRLNYMKLSSQSGFSFHELPNLSQDTITSIFVLNPFTRWVLSRVAALEWSPYPMLSRMLAMPYHIYYLRMPLMMITFPCRTTSLETILQHPGSDEKTKSGFSHQELSNSSQDTNIKQLKNVKQWSKPAFTIQELQYNSLKT